MSTMDLTAATKTAVFLMVDLEEKRFRSREVAYRKVARSIGQSESWLRKYLSPQCTVAEPRLRVFERIRQAYIELCERVEEENRLEEARITALKGQLNASTEGFLEKVAAALDTTRR